MTVIVMQHSVNTGEKIYLPGDSISGLNKKEEKSLVDSGICRYPDEIQESNVQLPDGLIDLGKGNYQLPNGEKVKGKSKALEAFDALVRTSTSSENDELGNDPANDNGNIEGNDGGPNTGLPGADV